MATLPSLGTVGGRFDNAAIESFCGRMRTELLNRKRWLTRIELANAILEYIRRASTTAAAGTPPSAGRPH